MLEYIGLKLKRKAKKWFTNLSIQFKPKKLGINYQFVTFYFQEFSEENLQTTLPKCYKTDQRFETFEAYFNRCQKYPKSHDTVKREVTIRYSRKFVDKSQRPLI